MSESSPGYLVVASRGEEKITEKGSRFLGIVEAVNGHDAQRELLRQLEEEFRDATHVAWAYRLGHPAEERCSDAGEPAGTAGPPILQRIRAARVSDALVAVVRWYGGTNLGRGGLIRAYGECAARALANARLERRKRRVKVCLIADYQTIGALQRLVRPPQIRLEAVYEAASVGCTFDLDEDRLEGLCEELSRLELSFESKR